MSRHVLWALYLLTAAATPAARAQEALTETQAVERALARSPSLRTAALEISRARAAVRSEQARYGYTLGLDGGLSIGDTPQAAGTDITTNYAQNVDFGVQLARAFPFGLGVSLRAEGQRSLRRVSLAPFSTSRVTVGPTYGLGATLSLTHPLLRGTGTRVGEAQLEAAHIALTGADQARLSELSALVRDVRQAYWELWYAQQALAVEQQAYELSERQRADTEARAQAGAVAPVDALGFATRAAALRESAALAELEIGRRARAIEALIGEGGPDPSTGGTTRVTAELPVLPEQTAAEVVRQGLAASPELAALRTALRQAEQTRRVAGEALRPRLDATGSVTVAGLGVEDAAAPFTQVSEARAVIAQVGIAYELDLDRTRAQMEQTQAALAVDQARARLEDASQQLAAGIGDAVQAEQTARTRLALAEETAHIAATLSEAETARFEAGARTASAVLEAQNELRLAQLRALRARVDVLVAHIAAAHLTGTLDATDW